MALLPGSANSSPSELQVRATAILSFIKTKYDLPSQTHPAKKQIIPIVQTIWMQCVNLRNYQTLGISLGL